MSETTACSCRWLHTIVVYDPKCPLHARTTTSDADCAHVWDRVLTQDGTPTQRQCQRCGVIQSGSATPDEDAVVLEGIEAFILMVQVIADQTATRSFAQIAEDELVKLRERVATSART